MINLTLYADIEPKNKLVIFESQPRMLSKRIATAVFFSIERLMLV